MPKVKCKDCLNLSEDIKEPWGRLCPVRKRYMDEERPRYCRTFLPRGQTKLGPQPA